MQAIWQGTISFGLIHIPIKLYSASVASGMGFRMLRRKDLCPISYVKVCRLNGEEVKKEEIAKGYEYRKGDYVIMDEEDFVRASPKRSTTIEVLQFVDKKNLSEELFVKPYYVEPEKMAGKSYVLLREALKKSKKVGLAKFIMHQKEHLVAIIPKDDILLVEVLRFKDDLKEADDLRIPEKVDFQKKELDIAIQLIEQMTEPFKYEDYHDTYQEELKKVIETKAKGKTFKAKEEPIGYQVDVGDIMEKLKKSLEAAKKKR